MNNATLSIIIPAYNAAATLEALVQACLSLLPRLFADIEVIIVDDGSNDDTPRLADRLAATREPVVVLHQRARGGYGAALAHGIAAARGDYIAALAADEARGADDLVRLVPALDRAAVVVGTSQRQAGGARGWLWGNLPRGSARGPLLAKADVLRALPIASHSRLAHPEIVDRASRAGHAVATVDLPGTLAPRVSLGESVELLRLRSRLVRRQPGQAMARRWQHKALLGGALAALLGGAWVALRRR